ncbi:hypothetical protein BDQ17DRAFT_1323924 [Cyathus striatus]|nr:hypothetical protein BDQ17DRAFT_1323924 [Cyathus striatus]
MYKIVGIARYQRQDPLYTWAASNYYYEVLDPRISYEGLKSDYEDDLALLTYLEHTKQKLEDYFHENYVNTQSSLRIVSLVTFWVFLVLPLLWSTYSQVDVTRSLFVVRA